MSGQTSGPSGDAATMSAEAGAEAASITGSGPEAAGFEALAPAEAFGLAETADITAADAPMENWDAMSSEGAEWSTPEVIAEAPEPTETLDTTETTEPLEPLKSPETLETPEPPEPSESPELPESLEPPESPDPPEPPPDVAADRWAEYQDRVDAAQRELNEAGEKSDKIYEAGRAQREFNEYTDNPEWQDKMAYLEKWNEEFAKKLPPKER